MKIYTKAPEVLKIARAAFPNYAGQKYGVDTIEGQIRLDSYWDGGSRDYFVLIDLATLKTVAIPENGTPFSNGGKILTIEQLPMNCAVVRHSITMGKDAGITVLVTPDNMNRLALPVSSVLTLAQRIVLVCTRERKSSYNGRNRQQMAEDDCGLPRDQWEQAKAECIAAGWLKANGALTDDGRNQAGTAQLWTLKYTPEMVTA